MYASNLGFIFLSIPELIVLVPCISPFSQSRVGNVGSFACFGAAVECAASKCANVGCHYSVRAAWCITFVHEQWRA